MTDKQLTFTRAELISVAKSLIDDGRNREYLRGICELIGRAGLDIHGLGEGTAENACDVASWVLNTSVAKAYRRLYR